MKLNYFINLIRLNKPIGIFLLFWPCLFGVLSNSQTIPYILILKFLLGAFLMRSAGCIINDIADRKFDSKVERTKSRPIASGDISIVSGIIFLSLLLLSGFILLLSFKTRTIYFSLLSLPLVFIYPFMKRITFFPQLFLGITFNFGVLVACMEINDTLTIDSCVIYIGCIFWTLAYDTIYGFMDIKDDKKIGVKSLSIFIENKSPKIWLSCFFIIFLLMIYPKWHFNSLISLFISSLHILWQIYSLKLTKPQNCLSKFKSNNILGLIISFGYL